MGCDYSSAQWTYHDASPFELSRCQADDFLTVLIVIAVVCVALILMLDVSARVCVMIVSIVFGVTCV
jgi:hypothetical protein